MGQTVPSAHAYTTLSTGTFTYGNPGVYHISGPGDEGLQGEVYDLRTELILEREKLDIAIKTIADLFESKPTLELAEQAEMRATLAETIDDLLERAANRERSRREQIRGRGVNWGTYGTITDATTWKGSFLSNEARQELLNEITSITSVSGL